MHKYSILLSAHTSGIVLYVNVTVENAKCPMVVTKFGFVREFKYLDSNVTITMVVTEYGLVIEVTLLD